MDWNRYIGIPFVAQGRDWSGVDCWGLVCVVYRDQGRLLPDYAGWYADPKEIEALASVANVEKHFWQPVPEPRPMDLVLLNIPTKGRVYPAHVGIVTDAGDMMHSERGRESHRESYNGKRWQHRIEGFYRHVQ